jgi:hypothetical protein
MAKRIPAPFEAIACNYAEDTPAFPRGALCFLSMENGGSGNDRVMILGRSRGGRWVQKWEDTRRLDHFRPKTIPPEHPRFGDDRVMHVRPGDVGRLVSSLEIAHLRRLIGGVGHRIPVVTP